MEQEAVARTTERVGEVSLRRFDLADVDAVAAWAPDPVPTGFMTWDAYSSRSREPLLAFLRDNVLPHPWFRAICLGSGDVVGAVSVTPTDDRCRAELGIVLGGAHWAKPGVAAEALRRAAATVLFGDMEGVERVEALVDADDAASRRALEDAGFRREAVLRSYRAVEGRLRDTAIYSFISTDPLVD